ncbi:MAG: hypothetical protein JNK78_10105 [Planctomycetes bacterium]|nr:hypothetical protein [Planctomycetota bacterium]
MRLSSFALLLVPFTPLLAQEPPRPAFDLRATYGVIRADDGTAWTIGEDYKACWTGRGLTFTPALGERARANRDLSLRVDRVQRGAVTVLAPVDAAAPEIGERHLAVVRGEVTERYDARRDGVEQSFVFATRPAGEGDLVVRLAVETTMTARTETDGTLFFHDGEVGGVRIGHVTGVDRDGRRTRGSLRTLDASAIELRLPADFVDGASYPMTLDPLLATAFLVGSGNDDQHVDAAHGAFDGNWLVVWQTVFSYFDQDIRAQRVASNGSLVGAVMSPFPTSTPETNPSVCYVRSKNMHVLCWNEATVPFGPFTLRARSVGTSAFGAVVNVSGSGGASGGTFRTCGDRSNTGSKALVVWNSTANSGTTIVATTLDLTATGLLTASAGIDVSTATGLFTDSFVLGKSRTPTGQVLLGAALPFFAVLFYAQALSYDGAIAGTKLAVGTIGPNGFRTIAIDGDGPQNVAVWRDSANTLQCRTVTWNGTALSLGTQTTLTSNPGVSCDIGLLGERYVAVWSEPTANPFDDDLVGIALKPDCSVCSNKFALTQVDRPSAMLPCVAPTFASGTSGGQALITWEERDITPPFRGSIAAQRFDAMVGAPAVFLSAGCGNGGTATTVGPFSPGNDDFAFSLSGGDPTAPFALISLSLGGSSILCGCELTNFLVLEATLAQAGASRYAFKPWCDPSYLGTDIEFQWLLWPAAQSPCPIVENLAASNRSLVTLRP